MHPTNGANRIRLAMVYLNDAAILKKECHATPTEKAAESSPRIGLPIRLKYVNSAYWRVVNVHASL